VFYRKELFRKLKFSKYINIKRNEQKMVRKFRKIYGNPEDVVICIGDWEQRKQMKYKEPTLGKEYELCLEKTTIMYFWWMSLEPVVNVPNVMEEYVRSLWCENTQRKTKMSCS